MEVAVTHDDARSAQLGDVRKQNVSSIMRVVLGRGPLPRAEIARRTGLAPASVTKLTSMLVAAGVCHELPVAEEDRQPGRPPVPVAIDREVHRVIGLHFGLLRTSIGVTDLTGELVDEITLPHDDTSFDAVIDQAVTRLRQLTSRRSKMRVLGIGASVGGVVDPRSGVVQEHPALGWRDAPLRDTLARRLRLPVHVDGSVRALAITESWFGAGRDTPSLLHVFVGNVVGAALLVNDRLHRGRRNAAGHLDHFPIGVRTERRCDCGRHDCLQAAASDVALVAEAKQRGILRGRQDFDDLTVLAGEGDQRAVSLLRRRARHVGAAIALLVEILDPHRVVIGGGVVDDPTYLPDIKAAFLKHLHLPLDVDVDDFVRASTFGRHGVTLSPATLCLDAYYRDPMSFLPP